jgi:amino acid transporter
MAKAKKFGALSGVFVPSILTILGVIMYLRLPWIVGQAGLLSTIGIILVAHIISLTTGLSVASIATDRKVESGGSYYIISRTLGLPIGGTLGLALFTGLSFSISLYLIGFAEVTLGFLGIETSLNNIRIAGTLALLLITILTFISTSLAIKSQYIILTILGLSLISVFLGKHDFAPSGPLLSPMPESMTWIALFAIFFPAVTGFEAGVSMSGDLKNPGRNIPSGTIAAVITGLVVYMGLAFFLSFSVDRELLVYDPNVLFQIAWIPQLVVAGIMAATLSSALGSILGAPRILQATANDRITPAVLGKGYGASNEPRNALIFTFIIAFSGILIAELNVIARIVTIFFIITYGFLNITYAIESWAGSDFRPTFKIPGFISIIGALACIIVMIQLDIIALIGASLALIGLFLYLKNRELTLQSGDTWNSVWTSVVKTGLEKLSHTNRETRNWRPNIILFSGGKKHRPYLIEIANALIGKLGILTNFELIESKDEKTLFSKNQQIVNDEGKSFTRRHVCRDVYEGIESISKVYGFSGFEPNTIMMGWARNSRNPEAFSRLLSTFKKLDYNTIFLHYNKEKGFGNNKNIDLWWSGQGRNLSFGLALIRFIYSSDTWRTARLRILMINYQTELTDKYYDLLQQVLDHTRIQADIKVINNNVERLSEAAIMHSESTNTDLAIIELNGRHDHPIDHINSLFNSLPTCMIIRSSTFFDELSLVKQNSIDERTDELTASNKPDFQIASRIDLAQKEIIANEIFNIAQGYEKITRQYFENSFDQIHEKSNLFQNELSLLIEKICNLLSSSLTENDREARKKELLRILNDYSFQAQKFLKSLMQELLVFDKQSLQAPTEAYFENMEAILQELPDQIRIKYHWKEFKLLKADSFATGIFKIARLLKARITNRPATYRINVARAARYFLYHKRLNSTRQIFLDYYVHSFNNIVEIRKILLELNELIEKGKNLQSNKEKFRNVVHMERNRFKANISLLEDNNRLFFNNAGIQMSDDLVQDIQNMNNMIDRPGSNIHSKSFTDVSKNDASSLESITDFASIWHHNIHLFVNKIYLDFVLQSLKNRIEAKINKYDFEFHLMLHSELLNPLHEVRQKLEHYSRTGVFENQPENHKLQELSIDAYFTPLFEEISVLFGELPDTMSVSGEDLTRQVENRTFKEAQKYTVSVRKTVEFSIASELIDTTRKQVQETSMALSKCLVNLIDIIKLINFHFIDEPDEDQPSMEIKFNMAKDFIHNLNQQELNIDHIANDLTKSLLGALKNAFAPLSSGTITKTSGSIEKKIRANEGHRIFKEFSHWRANASRNLQKNFVNLIYSKSEGILWVGRMDKAALSSELSNEAVYSFLEKYSPDPAIMQQLPFYYSKLFSGKSGIGDDFWVGMEHEIKESEKAIRRYKSGFAGLLLVTGERNSGKTSLSKYIARNNYAQDQIHNIRAPRECTADPQHLETMLLKSLKSNHSDLTNALNELQQSVVFIINDLELWWERRKGGASVIEFILRMVKSHSPKALFIININIHSLVLIHKLTGLQSWAIGTITCLGFDARQLKELIYLRHKAGGMRFIMDKKHENEMTAWDYARLFNRFFDLSKGNPGKSINLWLASIEKVSGKTLYMRKPSKSDAPFLENLSREQIFSLLQFIYHLRFSIDKLSLILQTDRVTLEKQILNLWQSGILVEKFPGIYAINSSLHLHLVEKLKDMKLL